MTDEELLSCAVKFELIPYDPINRHTTWQMRGLYVEHRNTIEGKKIWAIISSENTCLNKNGEWEWEPMPSSRTDEFFERCRWDNLKDAIDFAWTHYARYPTGYKPEH